MKQQQPNDIINIVVKIFQNVGIKRWIDKIQVLYNQQIYFEICKVIIPESMIKLFKLAESQLSTPQKIQGVINIVQETLRINLYHISGQSIAQGKLSHIKNFLHILQALSQTVLGNNVREEEVQSAPQNTRSHSNIDQEGHYTVIGMNKQFHNEFQQDQNNPNNQYGRQKYHYQNPMPGEISTRRNKDSGLKNNGKDDIMKSSDSQSHISYLEGKNIGFDSKHQKNKPQVKLIDKSHKKTLKNNFVPKIKHQAVTYQLPVQKKNINQKQVRTKKVKSVFMKKIFSVVQQLQQKKIIDQEADFNKWVIQQEKFQKQNLLLINLQSRQRIQFTNMKIQERQKIIQTLKGQKKSLNSLQNLFYQQRAIWKGLQKGKHQAQLEQLQTLIGNYFQDETLLRQALVSGSGQVVANKPSNRRNIRIEV